MSSRSARLGVVVSVMSLFGAGLWAQEVQMRQSDRWSEAKVAAAFEHDLAKAAKVYREIAGSPQESAEAKTRALLQLGKVLGKAGMIAEARAALQQASGGEGDAAEAAAKLLSVGTQDPDLLQVKVEKLIEQLRHGSRAIKELLWIGKPAAPYIVDAVDREKVDLEFISRASRVLFQMGGEAAEEWAKKAVKYPGVLKRRAVLKGVASPFEIDPQTIQGFLEDKEASVRRDAVCHLSWLVPAHRIIAKLKDPDPGVVQATQEVVQKSWRSMKHGDRLDENTAAVIGIFDDAGWRLGFTPEFTDTLKGRLLFLRSLRRDALKNRGAQVARTAQQATPTKEEIEELMTTADALGMATGATKRSKPPGLFAKKSLAHFVWPRLEAWGHEAMPAVLKLVSLNYGPAFGGVDFEDWIVRHGKVGDIPAIAKVLRWMQRPDRVLDWMAKQRVPDSALDPLWAFGSWLDGLDRESDADVPFRRSREGAIRHNTGKAIAAIRTADAERLLISLIRREPGVDQPEWEKQSWQQWRYSAFRALKEHGDDRAMRVLAELLVSPGKSQHARHVRYGAFEQLANLQATIAVDRYAKAYELGFEPAAKHREAVVTLYGQRLRAFGGLRLIVESRGAAFEVRKGRKPYSDETLAGIFDSCLATGEVAAFQDATYCVVHMLLPEAAVEAIANRALKCPDKKPAAYHRNPMTLRQLLTQRLVDRHPHAPGIVELVRAALQDRDPEIRRLVLEEIKRQHVQDEVVRERLQKCLRAEQEIIVARASNLLFHFHPDSLLAQQDYLLAHESASVQRDIAMALLGAKGADAIPTVGKLLLQGRPASSGYRRALVEKMAEFRDMRAVPFLLEALKDENESVRKTAEEELRSIRFYNEQKRLWKRLMDGTDLSAASAAEALVKQAREAGRKDVRLTAIESLGTLGKPETLPFLVKLMGDEDPDIRKAAKAAADRINAAKSRQRKKK